MLERDISREAIKLLTEMLADMAQREGNDFLRRWEPEPTKMDPHAVRRDRFLAGKRGALVTILAEPDFLLCFNYPTPAAVRARVVDLLTMPDRVIRHTWSKSALEHVAGLLD